MRLVALAGGLLAMGGGARSAPRVARVAGHVTIIEKDAKPTPDLANAVVFLDAGPSAAAHPATFDIATSDKEFVPRVVVVPLGSTVEFPNHDPFNHNVFSVSDPNQFDLGLYGRGAVKGHAFTSAGLVRVFCNIHPRMVAFVLVMGSRYYSQPNADGSFVIDSVPPGRYTLHVWHERSPQAAQEVTVGPGGLADVTIQLDARGFHWVPHKNKFGKDYPTNAGRERY